MNQLISKSANIDTSTKIWNWVQIREGVKIGKNCIISKGVYIDEDVHIGDRVKIQNNASIFKGVTIGNDVFIGPHVCFTNDKNPESSIEVNNLKQLKSSNNWELQKTIIEDDVSIGANSTILPGITLRKGCVIGAGSVVTKSTQPNSTYVGNPAILIRRNDLFIPISKPCFSNEEFESVKRVMESGMISQGKEVQEFETEFSNYIGSKYAIAVNSGTAALHSILYSLNIGEGDHVITTPFTFIASANCILMQNATPIFVDIDHSTLTLDTTKLKDVITKKTKAIICVNLFGRLCDYSKIKEIVNEYKHKIYIIEDACQSVGTKTSGTNGDASAFSFYATKNMTCGEGGMVTTNSEEIKNRIKQFRQHSQSSMYQYEDIGFNYKMTDISASIGRVQLKKLNYFNEKRKENANSLIQHLKQINSKFIPLTHSDDEVYHHLSLLAPSTTEREDLKEKLKENNIGFGIFYPNPLHLSKVYKKFGYCEGMFPNSENISSRIISIPIHQSLNFHDVKRIKKILY